MAGIDNVSDNHSVGESTLAAKKYVDKFIESQNKKKAQQPVDYSEVKETRDDYSAMKQKKDDYSTMKQKKDDYSTIKQRKEDYSAFQKKRDFYT